MENCEELIKCTEIKVNDMQGKKTLFAMIKLKKIILKIRFTSSHIICHKCV